MKLIRCVVREEKIDEVADALRALDVSGMTISKVMGMGSCERQRTAYRGVEFDLRWLPKMMLDIVRAVTETARTGHAGDGRIFVMDVDQAYTIRTRQGGVA